MIEHRRSLIDDVTGRYHVEASSAKLPDVPRRNPTRAWSERLNVDSSVAKGLVCRESQAGFEGGRLLLQRPAATAVVAWLGPIAETGPLSTAAPAGWAW